MLPSLQNRIHNVGFTLIAGLLGSMRHYAVARLGGVFRKVTNGFRCEWGAETYAAFRSVVRTAKVKKANRASVLEGLGCVIAQPSYNPLVKGVG